MKQMKHISLVFILFLITNNKVVCESEDLLLKYVKRLDLYFNLNPYKADQIADYWYEGEPYKKLIPDTSAIFRGCEFITTTDDTIRYILTNKIGFVWVWQQYDRGKLIKDDAAYMSIWDRTPEYKNKIVVSIELCKMDCGDNIQHLLVISDTIFIKIYWNDIKNNNPFWYLWFIK